MKTVLRLMPLAPAYALIVALIFAVDFLTACTPAPTPAIAPPIKEVPVPYHQPCPKADEIPPVPKHVAEEHPVMPTSAREQSLILAAKVLELFDYADAANGIMAACSKP